MEELTLETLLNMLPKETREKLEARRMNTTDSIKNTTPQIRTLTVISDKCPFKECDGGGFVTYEDSQRGTYGVYCRCFEYGKLMRKVRSARIPDDFKNATVKKFDPNIYKDPEDVDKAKYAKKVAIRFVEKYKELKDNGKGLYLYSATKGAGKTHLATSIANALIQKYHIQPLYISAIDLLSELKNTFQPNAKETTYDILKTLKEVEVLVIDDFGAEKATDWSEEVITQVLDSRMNYNRVTIFTSNILISDLSRKYPMGRIESRIEKMTFPVLIPEESVREILSKKENDLIAEMFFE